MHTVAKVYTYVRENMYKTWRNFLTYTRMHISGFVNLHVYSLLTYTSTYMQGQRT